MLGALAYLSPFGLAGMTMAALFVAQAQQVHEGVDPRIAFARPTANFSAEGDIASEPSAAGVEIDRARDGMFYLNAEINGERVRFLVDSGASVAVLTDADARRLGLSGESKAGRMDTVGGQVPMSWTTVEKMKIGGRHLRYVRAAIVDGGAGVSLIGQNVLTQFSSITIKGDHMRLD